MGFIDDRIYMVASDPKSTVYSIHETGSGLSIVVDSSSALSDPASIKAGLMATAVDVVSPETFITHSPSNGNTKDIYFNFVGQDQGNPTLPLVLNDIVIITTTTLNVSRNGNTLL